MDCCYHGRAMTRKTLFIIAILACMLSPLSAFDYRLDLISLTPLYEEYDADNHRASLDFQYGAIYQGYQFALAQGADYIFQTDSDGQTNPEDFWPLWETRDTYAYQIGWRRRREDGLSRKLVSWTLRQTILICCRVWLPDANAPFRLLRASALAACLEQISPTCPLTNVWLSILLAAGGFPGRFYPISFRPRQGGVNSLNLRRIAPIGLQAAKDLWALGHTLNR